MDPSDDDPCGRDVAHPFSPYGQLNANEIRLVDLLPGSFNDSNEVTLRTVDLATKPHHEALLCVWNPNDGTTDDDAKPEAVKILGHEDFPLLVTPNVASAIHHLRSEAGVRNVDRRLMYTPSQ
jgi:hypothetical protein